MNGQIDHDAMLELVAVHALGSIGANEAALVSAHVALCDECRAEYAALRPAADALAWAADNASVDDIAARRMKRRLMAEVAASAAVQPAAAKTGRAAAAWLGGGVFAALAAAIALAFVNVNGQHERYHLQERLAAAQHELDVQRQTVAEQRGQLATLDTAGAKRYAVTGGEILKTDRRIVLAMHTLPALAKGRVYQAWTLAKGAKSVAPSVTFVPDKDGFVVISLPEASAGIAAVAVSVEPAGGSRAPTTKPAFVQPLS